MKAGIRTSCDAESYSTAVGLRSLNRFLKISRFSSKSLKTSDSVSLLDELKAVLIVMNEILQLPERLGLKLAKPVIGSRLGTRVPVSSNSSEYRNISWQEFIVSFLTSIWTLKSGEGSKVALTLIIWSIRCVKGVVKLLFNVSQPFCAAL